MFTVNLNLNIVIIENQKVETEEEFPVVIPDDDPKYTMSLVSHVQVSKENNKISCILPHADKLVYLNNLF